MVVINLGSGLQSNILTVEKITKVMNVIWLLTLDQERPFLERSLNVLFAYVGTIEWTNANQS